MLSLVRTGPTILTISAAERPGELIDAIKRISYTRMTPPLESYNNAGEGDTLIFFSSECTEEIGTYQTSVPPTTVLCNIINGNLAEGIRRVRVTPPNIVMRLMGDVDRAIDQIALDLRAREAKSGGLMHNLDESAVLVNFTAAPLNQLVRIGDFYPRALLIDKPFGQLLAFLRAKAQEYLNTALGGPDWNEVSITLFDAMEQFNLHYQRLITVIQGLDLGIVIGESWEPEYTIALRKSDVYQVRILTPLPQQEIKKITMALEYDDDGRRVADFDVYHDGRKINWSTERKLHGGSRDEIGVMHRRRLLARLPAEAKTVLLGMDKRIDKSGSFKK